MEDYQNALDGETAIPYDMFGVARTAKEAQRARRMEAIYHKGQEKIWDGRDVFADLVKQYGGVHVRPEHKGPLTYVLSVLMWGEYAAWRVASQLADRLDALEPKLAATGQAHDEARHFYVMHDYITAMGSEPAEPDRWGKRVIELTLRTDNLVHKLVGMQLMIETIALTVFKNIRDAEIEPVLTALMPYYERDEARHVGLGTQLLPRLTKRMSMPEYLKLAVFEMDLVFATMNELKELEPHLAVLGINARDLRAVANQRTIDNYREISDAGGKEREIDVVGAAIEGLMEAYAPLHAKDGRLRSRVDGLVVAVKAGAARGRGYKHASVVN